MSEITFQKVTTGDIDINKFLEIERSVIGANIYSGIDNQEEAKEEIENNEVYFIKIADKIIGSTEYQIKGSDEAYLSGLVILPEFQGKGIARKAIEFRLEKIKSRKRVWVVTHPENKKIIRLYESLGFKVESRKENYYGDGEPRLVLVLDNSQSEEHQNRN